jgi:hypothetical protein
MRTQSATDPVVQIAERQCGVISRDQLLSSLLTPSRVKRWIAAGRLFPVHRGVYALGHRRLSSEARVRAALLYAGPDAALSPTTAAWWWQLHARAPTTIHLTTTRRPRDQRGLRIHRRRVVEAVTHRGLRVTSIPRTLLDLASTLPFDQLRRALAEADYRDLLDPPAVSAILDRGHAGSTALRSALARHLPALAATRSVLEERFLHLCERSGVPLPEMNVWIDGFLVDALWRSERVVVELDGYRAHASTARIESDRARDLRLRALGFVVLRYTWAQITKRPAATVSDLRSALAHQRAPAARSQAGIPT